MVLLISPAYPIGGLTQSEEAPGGRPSQGFGLEVTKPIARMSGEFEIA